MTTLLLMSYLPQSVQRFVDKTIARHTPETLVELAPSPCLVPEAWPGVVIRHCPLSREFRLNELRQHRPVALALIVDAPNTIGRNQTEQLLAYMRHAGAKAVLAVFSCAEKDGEQSWRQRDFIALGFRRAEGSRPLSPAYSIYRYDIDDYKITPSWLNSRYWANPERW